MYLRVLRISPTSACTKGVLTCLLRIWLAFPGFRPASALWAPRGHPVFVPLQMFLCKCSSANMRLLAHVLLHCIKHDTPKQWVRERCVLTARTGVALIECVYTDLVLHLYHVSGYFTTRGPPFF